MPYRTPDASCEPTPPTRAEPPELLGLGVCDQRCSVLYRTPDGVGVADLGAGDTVLRHRIATRGALAAAVGASGWALFVDEGDALAVHTRCASVPVTRRAASAGGRGDRGAATRGVALDGEPSALLARRGADGRDTSGLALVLLDRDLAVDRAPRWVAPPSSRALLGATHGAQGPLAVLATDRGDEVDLSTLDARGAAASSRTVSLGHAQRFECAAGGGGRIVIVSRGPGGLVVRTLARDLRSELNPVPIASRPDARIGRACCAHAGTAFVIAHEERAGDEPSSAAAVVVSVFDGRAPVTVRVSLPALDGLVVDGDDVVLAALLGGASGPQLLLYKLRVALDPRGAPSRTFSPRRYAYLLEAPSCEAADERRALLADVARAVALTLGAAGPASLALHARDAHSDVATFVLPGVDAAHEVRVALVARRDGSGVARVAIGADVRADDGFAARVRRAWSPARAGAGASLGLEIEHVSGAVGPIVSAVFGLRCVA